MRKRLSFITVGIIMALALMGTGAPTSALASGASRAGIASAKCSRKEARALVIRHHLGNGGSLSEPVGQVLCGSFVGPGSHAMVASLTTPGCGGTIGWVVFRLRGGSWQIVMQRNNGAELAAVGSGIKETQNVLLPSDAHCFPTGGTRSRTWHWNGSRFVASAWTTHLAPAPAPATPSRLEFAAGAVGCIMSYQRGDEKTACVSGGSKEGVLFQQLATLQPTGQLATCSQQGTGKPLRNRQPHRRSDISAGQDCHRRPFYLQGARNGRRMHRHRDRQRLPHHAGKRDRSRRMIRSQPRMETGCERD